MTDETVQRMFERAHILDTPTHSVHTYLTHVPPTHSTFAQPAHTLMSELAQQQLDQEGHWTFTHRVPLPSRFV